MDKLREDFEEWYARKYPLKKPSVRKLKLWEAYRDSRESIVVDIPDSCAVINRCELVFRDDVIGNIRSIGLSIKGE